MNKKDLHCMIDLETLGHNSDAAIIQIGAVLFKYNTIIDNIRININWNDALRHGKATAETLQWWFNQSKEARQAVIKTDSEYLTMAMHKLTIFCGSQGETKVDHFWAHATFDFPILVNACNKSNSNNPINFRKCRDLRTMDALYPEEFTPAKGIHHDALDDATYQTERLQKQLQCYFA